MQNTYLDRVSDALTFLNRLDELDHLLMVMVMP